MEKYTFEEFENVSYQQWEQLAEKALKGKPLASIFTDTYEHITLRPLYTKEDAQSARFTQAARLFPAKRDIIAQELFGNSPDEVNQKILQAAWHGQSVLHVLLDQATLQGKDSDEAFPQNVLRAGVPVNCMADIEHMLQGVSLQKHPLLLYTGYHAMPMLAFMEAYRRQSGAAISGIIGADPIGYLAEEGRIPFTLEQSFDAMASAAKWAAKHMPHVRTVFVRTDGYHEAGANAAEELAAALATATQYVREGMRRGMGADDLCSQLTFSFSVGTQLFMEIAKLRAVRVLWNKVAERFGATITTTHLHTRTSRRTKTLYDHHVNLLRATTEAFSAIIGGTDTLHVSTYNEAYNISDENSERLARNIQHILCGESHLSKVSDPASGSYYIEVLTEQLAERAWALFQEIEAKGGMSEALRQGWMQAKIKETAKMRYVRITELKQKIVGTNVYVNQDERVQKEQREHTVEQVQQRISEIITYKEQRLPGERMEQGLVLGDERMLDTLVRAASLGATLGEMTARFAGVEERVARLDTMRDAEPFERLREASEKYEDRIGCRPRALIVQIAAETKRRALSPLIKTMLEACGYIVSSERKAAGEAIMPYQAAAVFVEGEADGIKEAFTNLKQSGYSGKLFAVGSLNEAEKQMLTEHGASGLLQEASQILPLLHGLQNELEVIV